MKDKHKITGIRTAYPEGSMYDVRKFLMTNKYKGFRLGPYMTANGDSNVMVYTNEENWLMFVLRFGSEMDAAISLATNNKWWHQNWDMAGKPGGVSTVAYGRRVGKSLYQELYFDEISKNRNSSNRTIYANFERSSDRARLLEI